MITLRADQISTLNRDGEERYVERLMAYLRERQTVWVASCSDEKLRQRVKTGIARARSHGFTWENSIGKFVCLMFRWAPNFDECPAMKSVLERSDVEPEARADLLFDLTDEQWEAARRRYDPAAWEEE